MAGRQRVTSADVARAAGVSRATVSYVLNNVAHQQIPQHTRVRVETAARDLGYVPSSAARSLARGRSDIILLFIPRSYHIDNWLGRFLDELSAEFARIGLTLLAHPAGQPGHPAQIWQSVDPAAILGFNFSAEESAEMRMAGIELLTLFGGEGDIERWWIRVQAKLAHSQVAALTARGHRRIAHLRPQERSVETAGLQHQCLTEACRSAGLDPPLAVEIDPDPLIARRALEPLIAQGHRAFCGTDDRVAATILAAARYSGITVPEDMAVIGNGDDPISALTEPPLSTARIRSDVMAQIICELTRLRIDQLPPPTQLDSDIVELVLRGST